VSEASPVPEEGADDQARRPPARRELFDLRDGFALGGLMLMAGGLAAVWWPSALIIPGVLLFWLAVRNGPS